MYSPAHTLFLFLFLFFSFFTTLMARHARHTTTRHVIGSQPPAGGRRSAAAGAHRSRWPSRTPMSSLCEHHNTFSRRVHRAEQMRVCGCVVCRVPCAVCRVPSGFVVDTPVLGELKIFLTAGKPTNALFCFCGTEMESTAAQLRSMLPCTTHPPTACVSPWLRGGYCRMGGANRATS